MYSSTRMTSNGLRLGLIVILGTFQHSKDAVLEFCGFVVFQVEVCAWIPILACLGIIVGNPAVGIVEWTLQTLAWTVFLVVLEDRISHLNSCLLLSMYVLYDLLNTLSTFRVITLIFGFQLSYSEQIQLIDTIAHDDQPNRSKDRAGCDTC